LLQQFPYCQSQLVGPTAPVSLSFTSPNLPSLETAASSALPLLSGGGARWLTDLPHLPPSPRRNSVDAGLSLPALTPQRCAAPLHCSHPSASRAGAEAEQGRGVCSSICTTVGPSLLLSQRRRVELARRPGHRERTCGGGLIVSVRFRDPCFLSFISGNSYREKAKECLTV
jgi:hypothetical protein